MDSRSVGEEFPSASHLQYSLRGFAVEIGKQRVANTGLLRIYGSSTDSLGRRPCRSSADMEGPAVKWFGMACWISQSMLRFAPRGREGRAIPEDAGARLTMERLRRRIRLICAGCSEEPSRMTPLRRELPLSRGASRPDPNTGRRIADARTLQSCSHRAVANAARESRSHYPRPLLASVTVVTRLAAGSRVESWRPR